MTRNTEEIIQEIITFAAKAHGEQRRKFIDEPYINHPVRVMDICRSYEKPVEVLAAAVMHDVLEDTATTKEELYSFLRTLLDEASASLTLDYVIELTDVYTKASYPAWNRRKRLMMEAERISQVSCEAQNIKYADIIDNSLDIHNSGDDFAITFLMECSSLLRVMTKGDTDIRERAVDTVDTCILKLETKKRQ
jgi:(p)ppGpp synthase/HD superfamily hydrolase